MAQLYYYKYIFHNYLEQPTGNQTIHPTVECLEEKYWYYQPMYYTKKKSLNLGPVLQEYWWISVCGQSWLSVLARSVVLGMIWYFKNQFSPDQDVIQSIVLFYEKWNDINFNIMSILSRNICPQNFKTNTFCQGILRDEKLMNRLIPLHINTDSLPVHQSVPPSLYRFFSQNCLHILSKVFRSTAKQPTPEVGSIRCGSSRIQKSY